MSNTNNIRDNAGIAFALTVGAGLATLVGALVVFVPSLVNYYASRKFLAGGLGFSAGVMIFVSIEIFGKAMTAFENADFLRQQAYIATTLCFFGGIITMIILNFAVYVLGNAVVNDHSNKMGTSKTDSTFDKSRTCNGDEEEGVDNGEDVESLDGHSQHLNTVGMCCSGDPNAHLEAIKDMASSLQTAKDKKERKHKRCRSSSKDNKGDCTAPGARRQQENDAELDDVDPQFEEHRKKLMNMGFNTAVAIAIHNFPEGLATFVAALQNPQVGGVMAIAIAIHNIPEGMSVALPIYYATGNRWRAFGWAFLSGVSEPFAALLGWAVLANVISDLVYGVLFGLVCGMMVVISLKELLPTAHRYDPDDTVVTTCCISGMAVMAISLVLFAAVS